MADKHTYSSIKKLSIKGDEQPKFEYIAGDPNDLNDRLEELLREISECKKYERSVFEAPGVFFAVSDGKIFEISSSPSETAKGGCFPDIVRGPLPEENACMTSMMELLGFDEYFFSDIIDSYGEFTDEYALEYFEETGENEKLDIYNNIKKLIDCNCTPFSTIENFADALSLYGADNNSLYYLWDGEVIDFFENIIDSGEPMGYFEDRPLSEWISILENLDKYIVE